MNAIPQFVMKNGYLILFAAMFAHQVGVPLPGPLVLLAVGALVATGKLGLVSTLGLAVIGCVLADWVWYEAGRRGGDKVLHFIHCLTRDPDAHDRRAKATFARHGHRLLVVAKFVPGLDGIAPPLAGIAHTSRIRFLAFDAVGAGLYSFVYGGLGYVFSHDLDRAVAYAGRAGAVLAGLAFAGLFIHLARKLVLRYRSRRQSAVVRIIPVAPTRSAGPCAFGHGSTLSPVSSVSTQSPAENSHRYCSAPSARLVSISPVQGETRC
jgi:membrane protein DedA with SNARE-associated domain